MPAKKSAKTGASAKKTVGSARRPTALEEISAQNALDQWNEGGFDRIEEALSELVSARKRVRSGELAKQLDDAIDTLSEMMRTGEAPPVSESSSARPKRTSAAKRRATAPAVPELPSSASAMAKRAAVAEILGPEHVCLCVYLAVYFEGPRRQVAHGIRQLAESYLEDQRARLTSFAVDMGGRYRAVTPAALRMLAAELAGTEEDDVTLEFRSGPAHAGVFDTGMRFVYEPQCEWTDAVGALHLRWPLEQLERDPELLLSFAKRALAAGGFLSGHGGYAFETRPWYRSNVSNMEVVERLARRFWGPDFDMGFHDLARVGVQGANWLTLLGADRATQIAAELGDLSPGVIVHRHAGGLVLQAGPAPSLGDLHAEPWPQEYFEVGRLIARFRPEPDRYGCLNHLGSDEHRVQWLGRFDAPKAPAAILQQQAVEDAVQAVSVRAFHAREVDERQLTDALEGVVRLWGSSEILHSRFAEMLGHIVSRVDAAPMALLLDYTLKLRPIPIQELMNCCSIDFPEATRLILHALAPHADAHPQIHHQEAWQLIHAGDLEGAMEAMLRASHAGLYRQERYRAELASHYREHLGGHPRWAHLDLGSPQ